jgi:ADP-heptose:LPS heptosyltransferase
VTPVIVGGKAEGDIGAQIQRKEPRAKSIIGRTDLFQLATLSERALLAIGGDTGPMHLAAAARVPGVCLFAQEWNEEMALDLHTVWNPKTRLGRAAPRGGPMMVLHAQALEQIGLDDVKRAAFGLGILPAGMAPYGPVPAAPQAGDNPAEPPAESAGALAQGPNS